jgi:hypothetical protein
VLTAQEKIKKGGLERFRARKNTQGCALMEGVGARRRETFEEKRVGDAKEQEMTLGSRDALNPFPETVARFATIGILAAGRKT